MASIDYIKGSITNFNSDASDGNASESASIKKSDWTDKINEEFSLLYGYLDDLKNSNISTVLQGILFKEQFLDELTNEVFYNIDLVRDLYKNYLLEQMDENIPKNESKINDILSKITALEGTNQTEITSIILEIGIIEGILLCIPYTKLKKNFKGLLGEDVFYPADLNSLYNQYWVDIELQDRYRPVQNNIFVEINQIVTVYLFSRMKGELIDITSWLSNVTTNVTESGGNFSLDLNMIDLVKLRGGSNYYSDAVINTYGDVNNAAYLQNLIRENDLIFIKYERIQLEEIVTGDDILKVKGNLWDMIGLVDQTIINGSITDTSIQITGRDLIKLLIEDQNFFIPYQFANSLKTSFGGNTSKIFQRLFATGTISIAIYIFFKEY